MRILLTAVLLTSTMNAMASKTYTEEEFNAKVSEEVKKKIETIKNKSVADLTKEILDKEESLRLRELELNKKIEAQKISDAEISKKYSDFTEKQKQFFDCIDKNEDEAKARTGQLVEMIINMKPQKAAEVLSIQEPDVAIKILQLIDAKKASKIFNFMDKDVSAKLQKQYLLMKK
jgi:flagellar motility protein MotE (MotC chaperone)